MQSAHLAALLGLGAAGEQGEARLQVLRHAGQQLLQLQVRLGGQDLCGQHHGALIAAPRRRQKAQERHRRLAAPYIPLTRTGQHQSAVSQRRVIIGHHLSAMQLKKHSTHPSHRGYASLTDPHKFGSTLCWLRVHFLPVLRDRGSLMLTDIYIHDSVVHT